MIEMDSLQQFFPPQDDSMNLTSYADILGSENIAELKKTLSLPQQERYQSLESPQPMRIFKRQKSQEVVHLQRSDIEVTQEKVQEQEVSQEVANTSLQSQTNFDPTLANNLDSIMDSSFLESTRPKIDTSRYYLSFQQSGFYRNTFKNMKLQDPEKIYKKEAK